MHRALYIEEILLNIFSFCYKIVDLQWAGPTRLYANADLATLARTCRAFKDPALGIIWAELEDLSPLVRCLPATSWIQSNEMCSLTKRLELSEWHIILGYACRVRALPRLRGSLGLTLDCVEELSQLPNSTSPSLFPNLRIVGLNSRKVAIAPFLKHLASPKLTEFELGFSNGFGVTTGVFGDQCPALTNLEVWECDGADMISGLICHWQNLSSVICHNLCPNVDALIHLSRLRNLTSLEFKMHDSVRHQTWLTQSPTLMLTFSALRRFHLRSEILTPVWRFFHHLCVPGIQDLCVLVHTCPTASDLVSFFVALQEAHTCDTLNSLTLCSSEYGSNVVAIITFDHLRPLASFVNINSIHLSLHFTVDLKEDELLSLASSWPHLEKFELGRDSRWTLSNGITPGGFLQLLERCRSLRVLHFRLDTHGYTEIPDGHPWRGLTMPNDTYICLLDSPIEEESIDALSVFFHVAPYPDFELFTQWSTDSPGELCDLYDDRWSKVYTFSRSLSKERRVLRRSLETRSSRYCP
ncbi:hypothetical protein OG21DRAFT_1482399 [Imleria badia]|nr:hypothetical protein OG21DRAFT_1482399 [Imleria badia]